MTNSLINSIAANSRQATPEVGMGATILGWTDRHAATIIEVSKSGKTIVVQEDNAKRVDDNGMSESQTYEYTPNPEGRTSTYTLRQNGRWVRQGESMKGGGKLSVGSRNTYHDFSFQVMPLNELQKLINPPYAALQTAWVHWKAV